LSAQQSLFALDRRFGQDPGGSPEAGGRDEAVVFSEALVMPSSTGVNQAGAPPVGSPSLDFTCST